MKHVRADVDPEKCFSFGRCLEIAPSIFDWDDSGLSVGGPVSDSEYEAAKKAVESCPRFAISLVETDGPGPAS